MEVDSLEEQIFKQRMLIKTMDQHFQKQIAKLEKTLEKKKKLNSNNEEETDFKPGYKKMCKSEPHFPLKNQGLPKLICHRSSQRK